MSRQQQDADTQNRSRPRANTTSFPFAWRRPRTEITSALIVPATPPTQPLSLQGLIEALTPPAVPSLTHARSLASILVSHSPLPHRAVLNPVLASLCDVNSPVAIQAAGYDILSAYWENNEAAQLTTADRLSYFSLFLGSNTCWGTDLWEPRFKALRALTRYGVDIVGIELAFLGVLKSWILGAFDGLLKNDGTLDRVEKSERERSIDVVAKFIASVLDKTEIVARIPEVDLAQVLQFYAGLVDKSVLLGSSTAERIATSSSDTASTISTPSKPPPGHRRNHSSISVGSLPSPTSQTPPMPSKAPSKDPADIAITLYLDHLSSQLKTLSSTYLSVILPLLFRALAFCASPLPRLTVLPHPHKKLSSEDRITDMLNALFAGPYSTTCMVTLKTHLFPCSTRNGDGNTSQGFPRMETDIQLFDSISLMIKTSVGAHRTFRNYVRRALAARLARAYISRESSIGYSPSGAPGHMDMERDLMERAWPKEDYMGSGGNGWDAGRLGKVLTRSVEAWIGWQWVVGAERDWDKEREGKEAILEEAAGVLKDIWQELDSRGEEEGGSLDEEEACVVGETLRKLVAYVLPLRNPDGSAFVLPITKSSTAPSVFLRSLGSLLCRDHTTPTSPLLSTILIDIADNLTDPDTATLPRVMAEQHDLSPTSPDWLVNWHSLLGNRTLLSVYRPLTRTAIMEVLEIAYDGVRDMKGYRRPLADMVWEFCGQSIGEADVDSDDGEAMWKILGDEVVLRTTEHDDVEDEGNQDTIDRYVDLLMAAALEGDTEEEDDNGDTGSIATVDTHSPSPSALSGSSTTIVSPILSRTQSEHRGQTGEGGGGSGLPSVMSILSSLTTGHSSRSHSLQPQTSEESPDDSVVPPSYPQQVFSQPRVVASVSALISIFSQLSFTPFALDPRRVALAIHVYKILLNTAAEGRSTRARLAALEFLMHVRADRDHKLYLTHETSSHVTMLSTLINRVLSVGNNRTISTPGLERVADEQSPTESTPDVRKTRARFPQERDGRQLSRGRGAGGLSHSTTSRSRSRATNTQPSAISVSKRNASLWHIPESFSFSFQHLGPSEGLVSYDPDGPGNLVLPISLYLNIIISILEKEKNWEILSYVLCHLPIQLANKHLFCGPKAREAVSKMLNAICSAIVVTRDFGASVDNWSTGLKARDAQGLVYHTLTVLVSYRRCFDLKQRHLLVEVFQTGLNGQLSTIKCCLHALSLSAFELQPSMTKCLPRILTMLSQIMSNPNMAVHILGFLSIIGSLPPMYANFTEGDFKMVFGVALQFLQHYNRLDASPTTSWALSQHVRILSYSVVYIWFLAVKLQDRPRHISYITRQLLLANEGNDTVDDPTEVCFDWLARYTYASADPRPAPSAFNNIIMNPPVPNSSQNGLKEKSWILGHSVITVRTLARRGWIEVLCRRPSGYSKFLCRAENAPMVGSGDVNPDLFSVPATLMMERSPPTPLATKDFSKTAEPNKPTQEDVRCNPSSHTVEINFRSEQEDTFGADDDGDLDTPHPDPITGYVWSGTAPSQRRKDVAIDPSYFSLQLSAYPERANSSNVRTIVDPAVITKFVTSLDRIPVIDTHKVGIMYVAPGQNEESDILRNTHGSPAYTRFLEGIGRLINLRGQVDVYAGGLDPDEDGEYAYAWWDDIGQVLYHTATMMPSSPDDPQCNNKKRHIGNDYVRIVWNDSGKPYRFDTLATQFQFVNIVIEPHSLGAIAAFSNNIHENEYFKVTVQRAPGMTEFAPIGHFKLISEGNLPLLVRQLSLLADWFASVFSHTKRDTEQVEMKTNWRTRLETIRRFKSQIPAAPAPEPIDGIMGQEASRDFTTTF
ncbi:hypothetical protein BDZ94DRAFT_1311500 [Collybia nuda]|uniref:Rap-GAP domain-containing protein n=1 Tax=Collybia nuda TaxID=64659 RepID=A0A9P5Y0L3_9AGAR|nr:hypothetical protein BDZ94DRAFT_1311500 [Collybia nuda]